MIVVLINIILVLIVKIVQYLNDGRRVSVQFWYEHHEPFPWNDVHHRRVSFWCRTVHISQK